MNQIHTDCVLLYVQFSNMTIRCGDTGSRDNLCWLNAGDLHVDATPFRGISDPSVEGVRIEGFVFIGAHKYSTWATKPGDITFSDCEWRVRKPGDRNFPSNLRCSNLRNRSRYRSTPRRSSPSCWISLMEVPRVSL